MKRTVFIVMTSKGNQIFDNRKEALARLAWHTSRGINAEMQECIAEGDKCEEVVSITTVKTKVFKEPKV